MTITQPTLDGTIPAPKVPAARQRAEDYETWIAEVRPVFEEIARSSRRFTSWEIADERNLPDPPNPKSHWGNFIHRLVEDEVLERVGYDDTTRPGGNSSGVKVWRGTTAHRNTRKAAA